MEGWGTGLRNELVEKWCMRTILRNEPMFARGLGLRLRNELGGGFVAGGNRSLTVAGQFRLLSRAAQFQLCQRIQSFVEGPLMRGLVAQE